MTRMIKQKLTDAEVQYIAELEKEYHARLHSQGLCRCPGLAGVGLLKAAEPHEEAVMWNQILQKLDLLADKMQQLVKDAPNWLPLLQARGQAAKAGSPITRDRIAAEVKETLDKMLQPGSGDPRRGEPGSIVDLAKKALDEFGWEGVEALARTRRYIR